MTAPITPWGMVSDALAVEVEDDIDGISRSKVESEEDEDALEDARYAAEKARIAVSAGFPSGYLGNIDPHLFAEIHTAIHHLGGGDPRLGMERVIAKMGVQQEQD